jgi:predicted protein tyrosine phosphatase
LKRLLLISSRNKLRSPMAEAVFKPWVGRYLSVAAAM